MDVHAARTETCEQLGVRPDFASSVVALAGRWLRQLEEYGGFQIAVVKDGVMILRLCAGVDVFANRPISHDTLFPILSATKGLASIALLHLNYLGFFDWQESVAHYWPRFGRLGKSGATVEHLLSHRLGIPHITAAWERWTDRAYMTSLVEDAIPLWEPGTRYGYHGGSWGIIVDELVRRWTGAETGDVLRELIPSATDNCYIGLPRARHADVARLAYLEKEQRAETFPQGPIGPDSDYNSADVLASCHSSGGGVATAEGMAHLYGLLAQQGRSRGRRLWSVEAQHLATRARNDPQTEQPAAREELAFAWGLGFMVSPSAEVYGSAPGLAVAGHPGASGAVGYADSGSGLSVALTINGIGGRYMYERYRALGDMVRAALLP